MQLLRDSGTARASPLAFFLPPPGRKRLLCTASLSCGPNASSMQNRASSKQSFVMPGWERQPDCFLSWSCAACSNTGMTRPSPTALCQCRSLRSTSRTSAWAARLPRTWSGRPLTHPLGPPSMASPRQGHATLQLHERNHSHFGTSKQMLRSM